MVKLSFDSAFNWFVKHRYRFFFALSGIFLCWRFVLDLLGKLYPEASEKFTSLVLLTFIWLVYEAVLKLGDTNDRIEKKLEPIVNDFHKPLNMSDSVKHMLEIIKKCRDVDTVIIDFFGHNGGTVKHHINAILDNHAALKKLEIHFLLLDPDPKLADQNLKPIDFYSTAKEVFPSLLQIKSCLFRITGRSGGNQNISFTVRTYQDYPSVGGFRLWIPSLKVAYYYVGFIGPMLGGEQHIWNDAYILASVRKHDEILENNGCPPTNFYCAEVFEASLEDRKTNCPKPYTEWNIVKGDFDPNVMTLRDLANQPTSSRE